MIAGFGSHRPVLEVQPHQPCFVRRLALHLLAGHVEVVFGALQSGEDVLYDIGRFCDGVLGDGWNWKRYFAHIDAQSMLEQTCRELVELIGPCDGD